MKTIILLFVCCVTSTLGRKGFGPTDQEWGFVTVREGAHMFWWLHQTSSQDFTERPLIIWLQGGPGASSTGYGNFAELGPMDEDLNSRNFTWIRNYNVLFVDNPVGTGYSHVDSVKYLAKNNHQIAEDFLVLLKEFYEKVPSLKTAPLYIFSESYGGKMAAEIALVLDKATKSGILEAVLKGIGLGDAWISPMDSVMTWAPYLLNLGAIDQNGFDAIQKMANATQVAFDTENYFKATSLWGQTEGLISIATEHIDFYNVLTKIPSLFKTRSALIKPSSIDELDDKIHILMNDVVREALDLNVTWGDQAGAVFSALAEDFMKPATKIVESLLNNTDIKVAVFNGQLDLIVDTPGTIKWVDGLGFQGADDWKIAERKPIVVNDFVEGYYKKVGNLAMYWVNRAGHMVPLDNPAAMDFILEDIMQN